MATQTDLANTSYANVKLVRGTFEALNAGDVDACLARIAPDFLMNLAGSPDQRRGREEWREGLQLMRRAFPDIKAQIDDVFGSGDRVAVRLTFTGTHSGDFLGITATGRRVEYQSHEFYRVENGLLAEEWICSDMASLFQQIS